MDKPDRAEEMAREIWDFVDGWQNTDSYTEFWNDEIVPHLAVVLRAVRNETLEEAANLANDFDCTSKPRKECCGAEWGIAEQIRALKDVTGNAPTGGKRE